MKIKTRISAFMMVIFITLGFFTACGDREVNQTTAVNETSGSTVAPETESLYHIEDQDYKGYEFMTLIVGFGTRVNEFKYSEDKATIMDNAIYKRNIQVEDKLKITIATVDQAAGNTKGSPQGLGALEKAWSSGDTTYDAAIIPAYDVTPAAYSGYCYDLNEVKQFNLEADYWDQNAVNSLEIKGLLFFTTGDFSIDIFNVTQCIAFNKELAKKNSITDLYQLVSEGKWTIDKWKEYTSLISEDLDNDGYYTEKDLYGSIIRDSSIYAVVNSSGELCASLDQYGDLVLGLGNERVMTVFQEFVEFASGNYCLRYMQNFGPNGQRSNNSNSGHLTTMFLNNQALFALTEVGVINAFRDMETDYGILPYFKFDENQEKYYNAPNPSNARFLCLPYYQNDVDRTGNILEAIAYFSSKYITEAYYEKTLVGQTVRDDESLPVLKLLRETRIYDLGYYYQPADINKNLIYNFRDFNPNWASTYESLKIKAQKELDNINLSYNNLIDEWK